MPLRIQTGSEPMPGYRLIERLGAGGFGEIWKCQASDGLLQAIKIIHGDLAAASGRGAEQELYALRRATKIRHPFLLTIHRYDVSDGRLLVLMELADCSLWDRFRECLAQGLCGIPRADLLRFLRDVADGLDALRDAQLQHLDVKPQNLLLIAERGKVADFGLVRDLRSGRPGVGASPAYSAPEILAGSLSPHCDQYSLAVVFQELLTGTVPFAGATSEQLAYQHLAVAPNLIPLPPSDRSIVGRALAKNPAERFPSCSAFVSALLGAGWVEERSDEGPLLESTVGRRRSAPRPALPILPTVVLGIGGAGGQVLRQLRRHLYERADMPDRCPVRLLYIDTDPDAVRAIAESGALDPSEVLPTRLQRPDHYARLRFDGTTSGPISWFDSGWLKRLSVSNSPQGCRGLGRLAFVDHVRALSQKIEADIATVSRLQVGRPRVIIIAGLAGGTGSGMAIDLAYVCRHLLRKYGDEVTVAGWLLLPSVDGDERAPANAFAALAELRHFGKADTTYRPRCDDPGDHLKTRDAPFSDVVVLPLTNTGICNVVDGLMRELQSPVRPTAAELNECRTFGQARLVWPKRPILRYAARQLAARMVDRWTSTNWKATAAAGGWVHEQWTRWELSPESLIRRLHQLGADALGQPVNDAFIAEVGPADLLPPEAVPEVFDRLDRLLARLEATYAAASDGLAREWSNRFARPALALVEQPGYRLAAAESTVQLLVQRVEGVVTLHGEGAEACAAHAHAIRMAESDVAENLRTYPRWRHQSILIRHTKAVFATLREYLASQLKEIGLCRERLLSVFETLRVEETFDPLPDNWLLPPHCNTLADAARGLAITAEDVLNLDDFLQPRLKEMVGGLARACLTSADLSGTLGPMLIACAEEMLEPRLQPTAAVEAFLGRHPGEEARVALKAAWSAAAPSFDSATEVTSAILPAQLDDFAREAFSPDIEMTEGVDEITVVRSIPRLSLTALPQLGPAAKAAYQRRKTAGDSPHARLDIAVATGG